MSVQLQEPHPANVDQRLDRDFVSYSALSAYQQCPLKHYFKYVEGLPEESVSASLVVGGAIHSAAEFHCNELMIGSPAPDRDTLLSVFWDAWRDRGEEAEIQFGKSEDISSVAKTADRILAAFQQSELATPAGKIIGVEEQLRGVVIPGVPDVLARIDLIVESDDAVTVTDLKTARSRWSAEQAEDSGEQLLIYSELARRLVPDKEVRLEFTVVTSWAVRTRTAQTRVAMWVTGFSNGASVVGVRPTTFF